MTIQSSQVNENGPMMMIRGTKATIHLSDEWEGPPSRQYDYADIFPESPFADEFVKKNGNDQVRVEGVGNEGDLKHVDNFSTACGRGSSRTAMQTSAIRFR